MSATKWYEKISRGYYGMKQTCPLFKGRQILGSEADEVVINGLPVREIANSPWRACRLRGMGQYGSTLGVTAVMVLFGLFMGVCRG